MRVAVDAHDLASDGRGIGTYARALLARFARRDDIALTLLVRHWWPQRYAASLRAAIGVDASAAVRVARHVPRRTEVAWHPWNGTFFAGPAPAVATLHDLVPFALPAADPRLRSSQQTPFVRTSRTARAILCDSHFTAREAQRYLDVERARLHVVPLGVDPVFAPGDLTALPPRLHGRRYVLYVGAHDAHKNVLTLAAAVAAEFAALDVALVCTRPSPLVPQALVFAGVDILTLVALYRGAWVVAVPSLYEGFGLPVLEAMACGAAVLASRAASLPEVGGDVAAYVAEPGEVAAWRSGLRGLAAEDAGRVARAGAGPARAAGFSWDQCADRTFDILANTAAGK